MSQFDLRPPDEEQGALITAGLDPTSDASFSNMGRKLRFVACFWTITKRVSTRAAFAACPFLGRARSSTPGRGGRVSSTV